MSNMYDILQICLEEIENGADVDTVLFRYPEYAEELRPILETSTQAKMLAAADPSTEVMRRGRAKVMQQAAQMREAHNTPARRLWSVPLRRAVVSLAVIGVLFVSSTRLVQAASTTLPGDNLYPVKRTWEDVRVLFTFDFQAREALEVEHENERLEELDELFAEGRSAKVDFAGTVMSQNGDLWEVSKVPVLITAQTELRSQPVMIGDAVRVRGFTQSGGTVMAERVDVLPAGIPLPDIDDEHESEATQERPEGEQEESVNDNSGQGSDDETSGQESTQSPESVSRPREFSRNGVVDSLDGNTLVVNGQSMDISGAEIEGTARAGTNVKVEGYFDASGVFVVTKIEFENSGSGGDNSSNDNDSQEDGGDSTGENDDHNNDGNDNEEDGSNDNGGEDTGGDNSGTGGGGDDD